MERRRQDKSIIQLHDASKRHFLPSKIRKLLIPSRESTVARAARLTSRTVREQIAVPFTLPPPPRRTRFTRATWFFTRATEGNPRRFCSSSPRLSSTAINYYVRLDGGRKKRVFRGRRIIPYNLCSRPLKVSGRWWLAADGGCSPLSRRWKFHLCPPPSFISRGFHALSQKSRSTWPPWWMAPCILFVNAHEF